MRTMIAIRSGPTWATLPPVIVEVAIVSIPP
jgi:hypothetical protein